MGDSEEVDKILGRSHDPDEGGGQPADWRPEDSGGGGGWGWGGGDDDDKKKKKGGGGCLVVALAPLGVWAAAKAAGELILPNL